MQLGSDGEAFPSDPFPLAHHTCAKSDLVQSSLGLTGTTTSGNSSRRAWQEDLSETDVARSRNRRGDLQVELLRYGEVGPASLRAEDERILPHSCAILLRVILVLSFLHRQVNVKRPSVTHPPFAESLKLNQD